MFSNYLKGKNSHMDDRTSEQSKVKNGGYDETQRIRQQCTTACMKWVKTSGAGAPSPAAMSSRTYTAAPTEVAWHAGAGYVRTDRGYNSSTVSGRRRGRMDGWHSGGPQCMQGSIIGPLTGRIAHVLHDRSWSSVGAASNRLTGASATRTRPI